MVAVRMLSVAVLGCVLMGSMEGHAQTKSKSKSSSAAKATATKSKVDSKYRRLPSYFGQLKLKEEQRDEVYEVRAEYGPKIEELEKQLEKLKADMMKKMEAALTTTQKRELTKLRKGTSSSASKGNSKSASVSRKTDKDKSVTPKSSSSRSSSKK